MVDDFEFCYSIKKHGWTECQIDCNNTSIEFSITHIFSDSTCDLVDGLIELVNKKNEANIIWYEEPGSIKYITNL